MTSIKDNNLNPRWNEKFNIPVCHQVNNWPCFNPSSDYQVFFNFCWYHLTAAIPNSFTIRRGRHLCWSLKSVIRTTLAVRWAKDKLVFICTAACVFQTIGSVVLNLQQLEVSPIHRSWLDIINQRLTLTSGQFFALLETAKGLKWLPFCWETFDLFVLVVILPGRPP